jgi:hypothetical protein
VLEVPEWWEKPALERHAYFYPHADGASGGRAKGHAKAAEAGISTVYRKVYHNPDGHGRDSEFDFTRMARPQGPEVVVPAIS